MKIQDHILLALIEQTTRINERTVKALRFGLEMKQRGFPNNDQRLAEALTELVGVVELAQEAGMLIVARSEDEQEAAIAAKKTAVAKALSYVPSDEDNASEA